MDCKRMFRKEQIWFVHKDDDGDMSIHLLILLHSRKSEISQILWKNTERVLFLLCLIRN